MKKTALTAMWIMAWLGSYSQCNINGTHTDPTPGLSPSAGGATPSGNNFMQNTYDWTGCINSQTSGGTFLTTTNGSLNSPFWTPTTPIPPFAAACQSDYYPGDGWELVKQDFGYYYKNNNWNGGVMGTPGATDDPRGTYSSVNYFILYNKYSALLRVMCYVPNGNGSAQLGTIYVKLRFLTSSDYPHVGDNYDPKLSALFNHYNPSTLALDQKTLVTEVSAPCMFPANASSPGSAGNMFYADFQLAYDPCLCVFQSGLEVDFHSIQTANLALSGTYAGTTDIPVASITNFNGSVYGSQVGDDFITSIFENGGSPQSALLAYSDASQIVSQNAQVQQNLDHWTTALQIAGTAFEVAGGIFEEYKPIFEGLKTAAEVASKGVDFYGSQVKKDVPPEAAIKVESGYLKATGTITYPPQLYNNYNFRIGTPGSKDAGSYPEYARVAQGAGPITIGAGEVLPNYPMYNEAPGLFALLNTPKVRAYNNNTSLIMQDPNNSNWDWAGNLNETGPDNTAHVIHEYALQGQLNYAFNPIVNAAKSKVYAFLEIEGMPSDDHDPTFFDTTGTTNSYNGTPLGYFKHRTHGMSLYKETGSAATGYFYTYRTPSYPIDCMSQIATRETYVYHGFQGGYQDPWREVKLRKVTLVLNIIMEFNPDPYGQVKHSVQIQKYDCPLIYLLGPFASTLPGYNSVLSTQANLTLTNNTYSALNTTYSNGTLQIQGNQLNQSTAKVLLEAEKEIIVKDGSAITASSSGELDLSINVYSPFFQACDDVLSTSNIGSLSSYCAGSYGATGYQANIAHRNAQINVPQNTSANNSFANKLGGTMPSGIYPNPSNGDVYISLVTERQGKLVVNINDINGRPVYQNKLSVSQGDNNLKVELSDIAPGVYNVSIADENNVPIRNERLIIMK